MWHTCLIIALATNTPGPTVVWTATASKGLGGIAAAPVELEGEAVFAGLDGLVRGLDALTGTTRWEMAAGQGAPCVLPSSGCGVQSSPTVLSGRVVLFGTNDGELIAFDKRANGTKLWAFSTEGAVMGAAVVAKEAGQFFVYIGSDDRHLYKLQLVAGVPTKRWVVKASGGVNAAVLRVPPFVPGTSGHVVFTSFNGEVWAVREQDGLPLWKFNATAPNGTTFNTMLESEPLLYQPFGSSPLVIVTGWGSCLNCSAVRPGDPIGHTVFGLDARKGTLAWAFSTRGPVETSPQLYGSAVLVATERSVYSLAASDGATVNWMREVVAEGEHIEQLAGHSKLGSLYVCTDRGYIHALSLDTGDVLWAWQRPDGDATGTLHIRPSETDRHAYVSSTAGWVAKLLLPPR